MSPEIIPATDPYALADRGAIPWGHVRLSCGDPALRLVALLGPEAPTIAAGLGGWSVIARPRDVGMTIWEGVEPYQLTLSLLLDGWAARRSQEDGIRALVRVARGDRTSPPGVLVVEGIPLPAERWVIEGIEFGDPILATGKESLNTEGGKQRPAFAGERLRQALTLTLREYVPPTYARRPDSPYATSSKKVIYRVKKNDTPAKIAKTRRLKSWTVVRDNNRSLVNKANQRLKVGTKLRIPALKSAARTGGKDKRK